jgi:hypothetical protein
VTRVVHDADASTELPASAARELEEVDVDELELDEVVLEVACLAPSTFASTRNASPPWRVASRPSALASSDEAPSVAGCPSLPPVSGDVTSCPFVRTSPASGGAEAFDSTQAARRRAINTPLEPRTI